MRFNKLSGIAEQPAKADKSAVGAINIGPYGCAVSVYDTLDISLKYIIGCGRGEPAPTDGRSILLICIIGGGHGERPTLPALVYT